MPDLVLENVSKRYGRGPYVIEDFSATMLPGSGTGLVGPNGSGKTTLLRLLSVMSYPTDGRIVYDGFDIHSRPYEYLGRAGVVYDTPELPQYLSAVELLEYVLRARKKWKEGARERIDGLFDRLMLDERRHNLIGTYSSGMLAKAQIALALILEPEVLLLDEPFRGLDESSTDVVVDLLRDFRLGGGILVVSSHIKSTLEQVCDHHLRFDKPEVPVVQEG